MTGPKPANSLAVPKFELLTPDDLAALPDLVVGGTSRARSVPPAVFAAAGAVVNSVCPVAPCTCRRPQPSYLASHAPV